LATFSAADDVIVVENIAKKSPEIDEKVKTTIQKNTYKHKCKKIRIEKKEVRKTRKSKKIFI